MSYVDSEPMSRRIMSLFFLVDCSGSMSGNKIGAVNAAIENVIPIIKEISDTNPDSEIKIAILKFSNGCEWMYSEPLSFEDFSWRDIEADGMTSLGEACVELADKLSKSHGYMNSASGSFAPAIILLSDGFPTDNFEAGLKELKQNSWFKASIKIAIAIGDDADKSVLSQFTGSSESVIGVHNIEALKKIIRAVSIASSMVASKSSNVKDEGDLADDNTKQKQIESEVKDIVKETQGAEIGNKPQTTYDEWD